MKKILSLILALCLLLSTLNIGLVVSAVNTDQAMNTSSNISNAEKLDYLESIIKDRNTNFFRKILLRFSIIGIKIGILNVDHVLERFGYSFDDPDNDDSKPIPTDWEDGAELILHPDQTLPYTENGITITNIKITKYHNTKIVNGRFTHYMFKVYAEGILPDYYGKSDDSYAFFVLSYDHEQSLRGYDLRTPYSDTSNESFILNDDGHFTYECEQYNIHEDCSIYCIYGIRIEHIV